MSRRKRLFALTAAVSLGLTLAVATGTPAVAAVPPAPVIDRIELVGDSSQTLTVRWNDVGVPLDSYEIYYRASGTSAWQWSSSAAVGSAYGSWVASTGAAVYERPFRIPNAKAGQSYDIGLKALSTNKEATTISRYATVAMNPGVGPISATSPSPGTVTVSWPRHASSPFLQYDIYLSRGSGEPSWVAYVNNRATTSKTFTGLEPGQYTVGVRVTQSQAWSNDGVRSQWVRSAMSTASVAVSGAQAASNEVFRSTATQAFVDTKTGQEVRINGVNLKQSVYMNSANTWQTQYVKEEIAALGGGGAPRFNAVRIAMDWPYFQTGASLASAGDASDPTRVAGLNKAAFDQLDILIDEARRQGLYVILDPIHIVSVSTGRCTENSLMNGAHRSIPAWAWKEVGLAPGRTCENGTAYNVLNDDVLALPQTTAYLRYVLQRYDPDTTINGAEGKARGKQVIAVDLVNEPHASATNTEPDAATSTQVLLDTVYGPWVAPSGTNSLRTANPDKILILEPVAGSGTLAGVNLSAVAKPNVVWTLHDYFGGSGTDNGYPVGYGRYGWANNKIDMDSLPASKKSPYDPSVQPYAQRKATHLEYVTQYKKWTDAAGMPLLIGEYGIVNQCAATASTADPVYQYSADTVAIYDGLGLSRLVWTHGGWDQMAIWWRGSGGVTTCGGTALKSYLPQAKILSGEQTFSGGRIVNAG